jgi:uncharacterized membrane protein
MSSNNVAAPPWELNPSAWRVRIKICILAAIALMIAIYMGLYQWRLVPGVWDPVFGAGSEEVLDSDVAHTLYAWIGIPDALLGAIAYLGDIIFAIAGSTRRWQYRPWLVLLFGIFVIPVGLVGAILIATQAFVVGAWCFPCLITAVISILLIFFAYREVWSTILFLKRVLESTQSKKIVWDTVWGSRPLEAEKVALVWHQHERKGEAA